MSGEASQPAFMGTCRSSMSNMCITIGIRCAMPCIGVAKPAFTVFERRIHTMDAASTIFGRFLELLPCSKGRRFGLRYDQRFPCLWVSSCSFFPRPKFKRTESRQCHLFSCHDSVYDAFQGRIQRQCSVFFRES